MAVFDRPKVQEVKAACSGVEERVPSLLFVGVSKCATTTLRYVLGELGLRFPYGKTENHQMQEYMKSAGDVACALAARSGTAVAPIGSTGWEHEAHYCPSDATDPMPLANLRALVQARASSDPLLVLLSLRDPWDRMLSSFKFKQSKTPGATVYQGATSNFLSSNIAVTEQRMLCLRRCLQVHAGLTGDALVMLGVVGNRSLVPPDVWERCDVRCAPVLPLNNSFGGHFIASHPWLHDHVGNSLYGLVVARILAMFPGTRVRLHVTSLEEISADPREVLVRIVNFTGAQLTDDVMRQGFTLLERRTNVGPSQSSIDLHSLTPSTLQSLHRLFTEDARVVCSVAPLTCARTHANYSK
jgi:hypothetical protein